MRIHSGAGERRNESGRNTLDRIFREVDRRRESDEPWCDVVGHIHPGPRTWPEVAVSMKSAAVPDPVIDSSAAEGVGDTGGFVVAAAAENHVGGADVGGGGESIGEVDVVQDPPIRVGHQVQCISLGRSNR